MPEISRRRVLQIGAASALAGTFGLSSRDASVAAPPGVPDEDGYDLWLRYRPVTDVARLQEYRRLAAHVAPEGAGQVLDAAVGELERGFDGLLGGAPAGSGTVVLGTHEQSATVRATFGKGELEDLGEEGYAIRSRDGRGTVIGSMSERGVLYGTFHLLRLLQTGTTIHRLDVRERPANPIRMIDHWDDLDRNVERGYAGLSIFHWEELPQVRRRYTDYARALASVGINATVVNSVNANPLFLSSDLLGGLAALADVLRPWGVRFFLSANYASPIVLTADDPDPITTADPADERVRAWWRAKVAEIYRHVPDFGGLLLKANSEGQPGPLDYGRTHAEGANMVADALRPHGGLVFWRSFVHGGFDDWSEYQYRVFQPLDGQFADNVVVQTKNGPIDFQVREPVHPLFGAMPRTNQAIELQITQEYTGHEIHLCYLVPQWKEVLDFDTRAQGEGTTVARIVGGGEAYGQRDVGMVGVVNFGDDRDWTGYQLGAANTHGFGRLAWDPTLSAESLAQEWIRMTFSWDGPLVDGLSTVLLDSWRTYENYSSPLGMGYLTFPTGSHFDPDPVATQDQSHRTTAEGTGFDRTVATGTGFTGMYAEHWARIYESLETVPDELLLFMHWVPYLHRLNSGTTVIQHIYDSHFVGYERVTQMRQTWRSLERWVDDARHADIAATFDDHLFHAQRWRDVIVSYFFDAARILDERRQWLSYASTTGSPLLIGGWPNRLPVEVTNATRAQREITVGVELPDESWSAGTATIGLDSTASGEVGVPVLPPLVAEQRQLRLHLADDVTVLGGAGQPTVVAPAGQRCHIALDAGSGTSQSVRGYDHLAPETAWDAAAGYGWVGPGPQSRDRGGRWDALRRDFCGDTVPRTLRLALPAGRHTCSMLVGDGGPDVWPTYVDVDGRRVAEGDRIRGGTFEWLHFELDGGTGGREVDLHLSSVPGRFWRLCALAVVDPDAVVPPAVVTHVAPQAVLVGGEANEIRVHVAGTGQREVTVVLDVTTPDEWGMEPAEVQVPAGGEVEAVVRVTPPAEPIVTALAVGQAGADPSARWMIDVVTVPPRTKTVALLDGGSPTSPVLAGARRLSPEEVWRAGDPAGWVENVPTFRDRGRTDDLRRDFVLGRDADYVLRLAVPPGPHTVHILTGDAYSPSGTTSVLEGDTVLGSSGPDVIPQGEFRWFSFEVDGGGAGREADLRLVGALRDRWWRLVALVLHHP